MSYTPKTAWVAYLARRTRRVSDEIQRLKVQPGYVKSKTVRAHIPLLGELNVI